METPKVIRSAAVSGARRLPVRDRNTDATKAASPSMPSVARDTLVDDSHNDRSTNATPPTLTYQVDLVDSLSSQVKTLEKRVEELTWELHQAKTTITDYEHSIEQMKHSGYEHGYCEGTEAAQRESSMLISEISGVIEQCKQWMTSEITGLEIVAKDLVVAALAKIVGHEYQNPAFVTSVIKQVVAQVRDCSRMTIRVSKQDHEVLKEYLPSLQEQFSDQIQIQTDSRISLGGCLIETDTGSFDGRLETQIKLLQESMDSVANAYAEQR